MVRLEIKREDEKPREKVEKVLTRVQMGGI